MKLKSLLIGGALMLPLAAFAANPFGGAYAGLELGVQNVGVAANKKINTTTTSATNWAAGVLGGYNFAFDDNWMVGAQAYFDYNNADVYGDGSAKMKQTYGVDALLGYALNQSAAFYIGGGWIRGKITGSGVNNTNKNGFRAVVVAQQMLTDNLSLKETAAYASFNKFQATYPRIWSTMIGLSYGFNV